MGQRPEDRSSFCNVLLLMFCVAVFVPLHLEAASTAPLKVVINTVDKGEHFLVVSPDGDILLSKSQLAELGFSGTPGKAILVEGLVSLKSLSPDVGFSLNIQESTLNITASPELLETQRLDMGYKRPANVVHTKENSAFLNYGVSYSMNDKFSFESLNVPLETGGRMGDYLAYSNFSYSKTDTENRFVRLMTSITRDDTVRIRRYIAGDFFATSGVLGGSTSLGGLSITKNFSTNPYFIRYQGLSLSGLLRTPSEVDLYINNLLIKKLNLSPGEFDLSNFYSQTGAGNAVIVIRDAFGREQRIETPFYLSTNLLKPGLHDYSYNIGIQRKDFGTKSFSYNEPAFLGFHRYGFSETFTGGFRAEVDKDVISFGPQATFVIGRLGAMDSAIGLSKDNGKYGYSAYANYSYNSSRISGNASFTYYSKDYSNISLKTGNIKPRLQWQTGIGFNQKLLGSLAVNFQYLSNYNETSVKRASVFYNRSLGHNTSLSVSASRSDQVKTTYEVFAGLILVLGKDHFGSVNYQSQDSQKTLAASVEKNPPLGPGIGYKLQAESHSADNWKLGGNSYFQYNGPYGIYSAAARRSSGVNSYDVNMSGGIAFIDNSFYMSRPITDGFALVKVGDIKGAKVYYSNSEVATTNGRGEAVVPNLVSYLDNKLSFEATDIPVNYEMTEVERYIAPAYRSGSIVSFQVSKVQAFEGRLFIVHQGVRKDAESAVLSLNVQGKETESVVGKRGEFYLENLIPGKYPARLTVNGRVCTFQMVVPESTEMTVKMGDITCEIN